MSHPVIGRRLSAEQKAASRQYPAAGAPAPIARADTRRHGKGRGTIIGLIGYAGAGISPPSPYTPSPPLVPD